MLGQPGAVLAGGKVVGTWRPKASGRRLTLTVAAFATLRGPVRRAIDAEAQHVAAVRSSADVTVTYL